MTSRFATTSSLPFFLALAISFTACKGCKKDGAGENDDDGTPPVGELVIEDCSNGEDDNEDGLTDCAEPRCQLVEACVFEPPDPADLAPEIDASDLAGFADRVRFLYEGENPVIRGLQPSALDETSVAVLRARVIDADGEAVPGVHAMIAGRPELGYTFSRSDGAIDLVANGGAAATVRVRGNGFLAVDRTVEAPTRDYASIEEVTLTPLSEKVTALDGGGLAEGDPTEDQDGSRTARIWFPAGTTATLHLPDGQAGGTTEFGVRLTEYTVGETGPSAMPALLPEDSAYTYAVELSMDEADAVGATEVTFDQTGWLYLDNFLDFEVAQPVPSGYYSRERTRWEAEENGRVLRRVAGGVDVDGSGDAATDDALEEIGLTGSELRTIESLFAEGESFWRVPVNHFSPYDLNWPYNLPEGAVPPDTFEIEPPTEKDPCAEAGSLIECQNQALLKSVPLPGTEHALFYRSDRTEGRLRAFELPLTGENVPDILKRIQVVVQIQGRRFEEVYEPPEPNLTYTFEWDGIDAYGREVPGETRIRVFVAHVYEAQFAEPSETGGFGSTGGASQRPARVDVPLFRRYRGKFGSFDAKATFNMGGWALGLQHAYDGASQTFYPAHRPELRRGDLSRVITNFESFEKPTGLPFEPRETNHSMIGVYPASDGGLFIAFHAVTQDATVFARRHPDGRLEHVAGKDVPNFELPRECAVGNDCGEGGPPQDAVIPGLSWAVGPDDAIYAASGGCVRRITDTMERIVGDCLDAEEPEDQVGFPNADHLAIGPNSELYISGGKKIVRAYPGTRRLDHIAGCRFCEERLGSGPSARETDITVQGLAVTRDGDIYFLDGLTDTLARVDGDQIEVVHTRGREVVRGGLAAGPDGSVYWFGALERGFQLKRYKDGNVATLAGTTELDPTDPDGFSRAAEAHNIPATEASISPLGPPAITRDGTIYFGTIWDVDDADPDEDEDLEPVIKRIGEAFPNTLNGDEALLASPNGRLLYRFSAGGQLQDVRSSFNDLVLETLTYGEHGLEKVTDVHGRELTVERDGDGQVTAIEGPYGHRTEISLDDNGYATEFTYPDRSTRRGEFDARGLLLAWEDAVGARSTYEYDILGYLTRVDDPEGGWKTLTRTGGGTVMESSTGRIVDYRTDARVAGNTTFITDANGLVWETTSTYGRTELVEPNGTTKTTTNATDPRFGQQSEFVGSRSTMTPSGLEQVSKRSRTVETIEDNPAKVDSMVEAIDINGAMTEYEYDGASHSVTRRSPEGRTRVHEFDDRNLNTVVTIGDLEPYVVSYDDDGRMTAIRQGTDELAWTFDSSGYLTEYTGPDGGTARIVRDEVGRPIEFVAPSGRLFSYGYDARGHLTSVEADGSAHRQEFNGYDNLAAFASPAGDSDTFEWTADRTLSAIRRANGMERTIEWDESGRVAGWASVRGAGTRTFDPGTGQPASSQTPDGSVDLRYDGFLIAARDISFEGQAHTIEREHDDDFRVVRRTVAGASVDHEYDLDGIPTRAGDAQLTIDPDVPLVTEETVGGIDTTYTWDDRGRLVGVVHADGNTVLYEVSYTYGPASRLMAVDETIDATTSIFEYSYDADGWLLAVSRDGVSEAEFTYDDRGNRTGLVGGMTASFDTSNRIESAGTRTYSVDPSGFVTGWTDGAATTSFDYDHHELTSVTNDGGQFEYGYDSLGRRIWRRANGTFDRGWLYDDIGRPYGEVDETGALVSRFVYTTTDAVPAYMTREAATYRIITDQVGSVRLVVDVSNGQIVQRIDYDPLGRVVQDTNPGFQPFGFAGGLHDPDTGLVRLGRRDYDPFTGRWLSPDPSGFGGLQYNLYAYAHNDPVNLIDTDGEVAWAFIGKGLVAAGVVLAPLWVPAVQWKMYEKASNARAKAIAQRRGIGRKDAENAMRHCVGQCVYNKLTLDTGIARAAGAYHENPDIPKTVGVGEFQVPTGGGGEQNREGGAGYWDGQKDRHNNVCGRECSRQDSDCLDCCAADLEAGLLATDLSDSTMVSDELLYTPAPTMSLN